MTNKSYAIGYRFEARVRTFLESFGYLIIRAGKSRFPDGAAMGGEHKEFPKNFVFECKKNKYLDREEKIKAKEIAQKNAFFVFWNDHHKIAWYKIVGPKLK